MPNSENSMNEKLRKLGVPLRAIWAPNPNSRLSGEVKGGTLYVYEENPERAYETFWHEVVDFYVSRVTEPYKLLLNTIIRAVNDDAYKRKEETVEALKKIIEELANE